MRGRSGALKFLALLVLLVTAVPLFAQSTSATLRGKVIDDTGPIPGATISVISTQTGFRYETTAANDGAYQIAGVTPGTYDIKVSSPAYKEKTRTVQLLVGQSSRSTSS